jgi:hypothetical protein
LIGRKDQCNSDLNINYSTAWRQYWAEFRGDDCMIVPGRAPPRVGERSPIAQRLRLPLIAANERSRFVAAEEAPVEAPERGSFMTLLRRRRKRSRQTKNALASEGDSHK